MKKLPFLILLPWMACLFAMASEQEQLKATLEAMPTSQLEKHLAEIDSNLHSLSSFSLRGGTGAIGYRSFWGQSTQWVEIELEQEYPIDEIVLVPCLWRHPTEGFLADAFPRKLSVFAGTGAEDKGSLIASYEQSSDVVKGIEPLVLPIGSKKAKWVRIEATELSARNFDGNAVLQLSEILIFSGTENVALHRPVRYSSSDRRGLSKVWNEVFLVDGFMPYLMNSAKGGRSNAYIAIAEKGSHFTLDLGEAKDISRINLHAVEQSDTVPQAYPEGLGIPDRMRIEGALSPDFSDAVTLIDFRKEDSLKIGPIIKVEFPKTSSRYIRLSPLLEVDSSGNQVQTSRIGFAEIEVYADGINVALNKVATSEGLNSGQRSLSALTDGNNLYGEILQMREWMNELAKRGELERERPILLAELNLRYEQQKSLLVRMIQLVVILIVAIGFVILSGRYFRMRKVNQVRERIAADLHDELGANIHTIGLISDMAKNSIDSRDELKELLGEIRTYTERSGEAARYCTNILEARGVCENLIEEMTQFANRILADLEHEFSVVGEVFIKNLSPHTRIDLLLFYKECLTNILRHSGATKVKTRLFADSKSVSMIVSDNGIGLDMSNDEKTPNSLKRRAKLLRATIKTERSVSGGARITLKLKTRKFSLFK